MQQFLNKYQVFEKKSQDSLGIIYRARNITTHQPVMIECITSGAADITALKWRLDQILEKLKKLRHRNVVPLIDFFVEAEQYFLIQEFWQGETLDEWLLEMGRMSVKLSVPVLAHILDAFEFAHQQGLVYGHLTTDSIIMIGFREAKILNFGLAYLLSKNGLVNVENRDGTIMYAAPEQLIRPTRTDRLTDIYRLGLVLYQMLTAKLPLAHESNRYLVRKTITTGQLPAFLEFPPNVSDDLKKIVYKAIHPQPEKRYQNAAEMKKSLLASHAKRQHFISKPKMDKPRAHVMRKGLKIAMSLLNIGLVALIIYIWLVRFPRDTESIKKESTTLDRSVRDITQDEILDAAITSHYIDKSKQLEPIASESATYSGDSTVMSLLDKKSLVKSERAPPAKTVFPLDKGSIYVSSRPSDAKVEILRHNKSIRKSRTPCRFINLPLGRLSVRVIHAGGYQVFEQDVNVQTGIPTIIEAELKYLPIALRINSEPEGAQIILDGKRVDGVTPLTINMSRIGKHRIRFIKRGFKPVEETFSISSGQQSFHLFKKLPGEAIDFTIRLLYPARIYLNGVAQNYEWQEKIYLTNIYPKKYSLMVLYKNKQSQIKELYITPAYAGKVIDIYP